MDAAESTCLNCSAPLRGEYCAQCGQRKTNRNPTLREFIGETFREMFEWDGKIPATLRALLAHPGLLTEDFLAGRRARWISPLRVYLICSVAYFLVDPVVAHVTGRPVEQRAAISFTDDTGGRVSLDELTPEALEALASAPIFDRIGVERLKRIGNNSGAISEIVVEAIPKAMFVLMPLFALLTWSAWRSGGARYPAHLYFSLHLHAAFFAAIVLPSLAKALRYETASTVLGALALVYSTWYGGLAIKRVLGGTTGQLIGRSLVVGTVYSVALLAVIVGITVAAMLQF
ncbi:MAG: DUF3667 domain-containing protein [Gemmatimonadetes bacterium]|nr:DUF3667 domain-containing protein [Gemmatimonadota bacterium]